MSEETETPKSADAAGRLDGIVNHELSLLRQFFYCWTMAENNRGCYSCCEQHDCRCPASTKRGPCVCYRDELNKLEYEVYALQANDANEPRRHGD